MTRVEGTYLHSEAIKAGGIRSRRIVLDIDSVPVKGKSKAQTGIPVESDWPDPFKDRPSSISKIAPSAQRQKCTNPSFPINPWSTSPLFFYNNSYPHEASIIHPSRSHIHCCSLAVSAATRVHPSFQISVQLPGEHATV
jgi:hypothetical protein